MSNLEYYILLGYFLNISSYIFKGYNDFKSFTSNPGFVEEIQDLLVNKEKTIKEPFSFSIIRIIIPFLTFIGIWNYYNDMQKFYKEVEPSFQKFFIENYIK